MSRLLDVELDQYVLVVADAICLDLVENFPNQGRGLSGSFLDLLFRRLLDIQQRGAEDALSFAATATDSLEAYPAAGIFLEHVLHFDLHLGAEFLDGIQIDSLCIGGIQNRIGKFLKGELCVLQDICSNFNPLGLGKSNEFLACAVLADQGPGSDVVDAGSDTDSDLQSGPLGFILLARIGRSAGVGTHERQACGFDSGNELLVLGHESVPGEDGVVPVVLGNLDDLAYPLDPLLLAGAGIVGHPVHAARIVQLAKFRRQGIGENNGILFRKQDAVMADPHLFENVHRLFADRAATDDQRLQILTCE